MFSNICFLELSEEFLRISHYRQVIGVRVIEVLSVSVFLPQSEFKESGLNK